MPRLRQHRGHFPSGKRPSGAPCTGTWGKSLCYTYSPEKESIIIVFSNNNCKKGFFSPFFFQSLICLQPIPVTSIPPRASPVTLQHSPELTDGARGVRGPDGSAWAGWGCEGSRWLGNGVCCLKGKDTKGEQIMCVPGRLRPPSG